MSIPQSIAKRLRLPIIGSPLFIISNPDLVIAQCKAGIIGSFPALNARPGPVLDEWLKRITSELAEYDDKHPDRPSAPWRETPEQPGKSRGDEARPHVDINDTCRDVRPAQTSLPRSDQPVVGTGATQTPPMGSPPAASSAPDAHPPAPTAALRHPHVDHRTPLRRPLSDEDRPRNLAPSGWRSAAGAAATPDIHITIGRIEIRAQTVQSPRQPAQPEASHVDLDAYLSARTAGLRS